MVLGARRPASDKAAVRPRLLASLVDLAVIGGWLGVLTVVGAVVRRFLPDRPGAVPPPGPARLAADVGIFAGTVLPTGLYLGLAEAGAAQAGPGKRRLGLRVVDARGGRPDATRIAVRTLVKLLPWQLAHLSVARMMWRDERSPITWPAYVASLAIPLVSVVLALRDPEGRALHDRVAGTRVVGSDDSRA